MIDDPSGLYDVRDEVKELCTALMSYRVLLHFIAMVALPINEVGDEQMKYERP